MSDSFAMGLRWVIWWWMANYTSAVNEANVYPAGSAAALSLQKLINTSVTDIVANPTTLSDDATRVFHIDETRCGEYTCIIL